VLSLMSLKGSPVSSKLLVCIENQNFSVSSTTPGRLRL